MLIDKSVVPDVRLAKSDRTSVVTEIIIFVCVDTKSIQMDRFHVLRYNTVNFIRFS